MTRRGTACLLVFFLIASPLAAQEWARKMFDATSCDFGAVARGSKVEHRFKITNLYKETVHIASVRSSCGCTSPEVTRDTLATHETADLIARFNTRAFLGHKSATVTVTFDQPFYAEVQLQVSGYIRSDIVLDPPQVQFGSVDEGTQAESTIAVRYAGRDDWAIQRIESNNPFLKAELRETDRQAGNVAYELVVRLLPGAPTGYLYDQLWVHTNDRRATRFPLIIEGQIQPEISITPASLFLGKVEPGQTVTKNVIVRGKRPFRVLSVDCPDQCFQFRVDDKSATVHAVRITFTAAARPGPLACKIHIRTDLDAVRVPELTAQAEVVAPVQLSASN